MHTSQFSELFENRDIVIIGGSPNVEIPEDFEEPFIIGTNQHKQGEFDFVGMVCCACAPAMEDLWTERMEFLAIPKQAQYRDQYIEVARRKKVRSIVDYPIEITIPSGKCKDYQDEWAHSLLRRLKCRPFTGIYTSEWIMKYPFRRLHLTGFSFYYSSQRQAFPIRKGNHHIRQQMELLREYYMADDRISADTTLEVILYEGVKWPPYSLSYHDIVGKVTEFDERETTTVWKEVPYSKHAFFSDADKNKVISI
jgi:hypothetical protein